jgi:hypothetical protein
MNSEDARRKLQLLQKVRPENGFSDAEAENAVHLSLLLVKRFSIRAEEVRPNPAPAHSFALSWVYWQHLADEYGLKLHRFGGRGNLTLPDNRAAFIKLGTGEWWVQKTGAGGHERVARNWGVESLRAYLARNRTRAPSFLKR